MKYLKHYTPSHWYDWLLNQWPFCIDANYIHTIGIAWIFKEHGKWNVTPRITGDHQYYNAQFFIRFGWLGIWFHTRLSATRLFQCGIGWKQNGRVGIHFRFQTDESAAHGTTSHNYGQSTGWSFGEH